MRVHSLTGDQGAVAIVVALMLTVFAILCAIAVDIGNAYANGRQLSVAADAASLAAAAKVGEAYTEQYPNEACVPANLTTMNAAQIAQTEADRINTANNKTGASEPVGAPVVTCENSNKSIQVSIANSREVETALAGIIGINSIKPNSFAIARYQKSSGGGGLRPWAMCETTANAARANPNRTYWTPLGNWNVKDGNPGICGTSAPGNWGSVDFDGKTGGNSAGDLADWTRYGYPGPVTIPNPAIPADPGVSGSSPLKSAFDYLVNKVVLFPAVASISGTGDNATFDTLGVLSVKVCGFYYNNVAYNTGSGCWESPSPTTTSTPVVSPVDLVSMADGSNVVTTTTTPDGFESGMVGGMISVPGAGNNAGTSPLTGEIASVSADGLTATLTNGDKAKAAVSDVSAVVTWTKVDTVPGSFDVPVDKSGKTIDHVQFRWVNYITTYRGPGTTTCELSDPLCAGTTLLWK